MKRQIHIREIPEILKRRKLFLAIPFILILLMSILGAYTMPEKYESYTTILLQKDEILNPLVSLSMAVSMSQADRLTSFNEIIYSRSTIVVLLDSLGVLSKVRDHDKLEDLIAATRRNFFTTQRGSDSFRITVYDSNPVMAQRQASLLAKIYIQMTLKSNQQQNEEAVKFFEQKVEEYHQQFEEQQKEFLNLKRGRLSTLPQGESAYSTQLDHAEAELEGIEKKMAQQIQARNRILYYIDNIDNPATISQISSLETEGAVLYVSELKSLSVKYSELTSRYTQLYPQVQMVRQQLLSMLTKSVDAITADIDLTKSRKKRAEERREEILQNLDRAYGLSEMSDDQRAVYEMTRKFYFEMKTKLQQAKVSRDLGEKGESKYVILDAAQVPSKPSKPNRRLIIAGGAGLGFIIGIVAVFLGEILDPTIRRPQDIEVFQKPIIAYLP